MRHEAIIKLYAGRVANQVDDRAYDMNGLEISIDEDAVAEEVSKLLAEVPMRLLREERNRRIALTDWRFRSDLSPSQEWKDYCAALRNLPQTYSPTFDILTEDGYPLVKEDNTTPWPEDPNDG